MLRAPTTQYPVLDAVQWQGRAADRECWCPEEPQEPKRTLVETGLLVEENLRPGTVAVDLECQRRPPIGPDTPKVGFSGLGEC